MDVVVLEHPLVSGDELAGGTHVWGVGADFADCPASFDADADEESGVLVAVDDVNLGDCRASTAAGPCFGLFGGDLDVGGVADGAKVDALCQCVVSPRVGGRESPRLPPRPLVSLLMGSVNVLAEWFWVPSVDGGRSLCGDSWFAFGRSDRDETQCVSDSESGALSGESN